MTDRELIGQFIDDKRQSAFSQIVDRHMKLVYWTCRRDIGNPQLAEDAVQTVFLVLASKASQLRRRESLAGWLFATARLVSRNAIRQEAARKRIEEEAVRMTERTASDEEQWARIEPLLNDGLASLAASDREAVLLRFYDGLSLKELAEQTNTTEEAARKRVARAVDRLRHHMRHAEAAAGMLTFESLLGQHCAPNVPASLHAIAIRCLDHATASSASPAAGHNILLKKGLILAADIAGKKAVPATAIIALGICAAAAPIAVHRLREASAETSTVTIQQPVSFKAQQSAVLQVAQGYFDGITNKDIDKVTRLTLVPAMLKWPGVPQRSKKVTSAMKLLFAQEGNSTITVTGAPQLTHNKGDLWLVPFTWRLSHVVKIKNGPDGDSSVQKVESGKLRIRYDNAVGRWYVDGGL